MILLKEKKIDIDLANATPSIYYAEIVAITTLPPF